MVLAYFLRSVTVDGFGCLGEQVCIVQEQTHRKRGLTAARWTGYQQSGGATESPSSPVNDISFSTNVLHLPENLSYPDSTVSYKSYAKSHRLQSNVSSSVPLYGHCPCNRSS